MAWRVWITGIGGALLAFATIGIVAYGTDAAPARAAGDCSGGSPALDAEESAFLGLINAYRAQNGMGPLAISNTLNRAAAWMVHDMGTKGYFAHTDSLGRSPAVRVQDCGYPSGAGENLAAGTAWATAQAAFEAWKASPGHNANMLTSFYQVIGIARENVPGSPYGWYWATNFGVTNDGGAPPPTSTPTPVPTTATPTTPAATATPSPVPTTPAATTTTATTATATPTVATATPATATSTPPAPKTPSPTSTTARTATPAPSATATPSPPPTPSPSPSPTPTKTATPTATATAAPRTLPLYPGANLVTWPNAAMSAREAFGSAQINIVYTWDPVSGTWQRFGPALPAFVNSLQTAESGRAYWVIAKGVGQLLIAE
ncbi:MAG: CAP domain-containing protein [Dehalococcoidia bacterium]|nr:CAP domain-containing protein [Dehalococcoidia bacterium]